MLALRDIKTLKALVKTATPEDDKEAFKDLNKQVKDVEKAFKDAEKSFRTPAKTPGITYTADKVGSKLGLAFFYVGSTEAKPSKAALAQIAVATNALNEAVESVNKLIGEDLASLKSAVNEAGIGLLNQTQVSDAE